MVVVGAALGPEVLKVSQRQRVFHLYHDHEPDDLGRRIEMPEWAFGLGHLAQNMSLAILANFALTTPRSFIPFCCGLVFLVLERDPIDSSRVPRGFVK